MASTRGSQNGDTLFNTLDFKIIENVPYVKDAQGFKNFYFRLFCFHLHTFLETSQLISKHSPFVLICFSIYPLITF